MVYKCWRTVALKTPAFFGRISHWLLMLERAKHAPLSIHLKGYRCHENRVTSITPENLSALINTPQLQRLHVRCATETMGVYAQYFPQDAPLLESLHTQCSHYLSSTSSTYPLPPQVLSSAKPVLRHVTLTSCIIPWPSVPEEDILFCTLSTLTLHYTSPPIPLAILWDLLLASSNLEELDISHTLSPTLGVDASGSRITDLWCPDKMSLDDHWQPISQLLLSVKCSPSSKVEACIRTVNNKGQQTLYFMMILEACRLSVNNTFSTLWNLLQAFTSSLMFHILSGTKANNKSKQVPAPGLQFLSTPQHIQHWAQTHTHIQCTAF